MLDWLLAAGRAEDALRALSALERFWRGHSHVSEARRWLALALDLGSGVDDGIRAAGLRTAALQAAAQSDWQAAELLLAEARSLYRQRGDDRDEVLALGYLSFFAGRQHDIERAQELAEEAVAIAANLEDDRAASGALSALADVYAAQGRHELALVRYEEALALRRRLGDPQLVVDAVYYVGVSAYWSTDLERARRELESALTLARAVTENAYVAAAQLMLALVDVEEDDFATAAARAQEAADLYARLQDSRSQARCTVVLAAAAAADGDMERAARLTGVAQRLRGDEAADELETPVLERYRALLDTTLGEARATELLAEGSLSADHGEVVTLATQE